ncbi:MAG: class I SAM-dependent methyltransferase [Bacteroidales bacterium]|jgi:hypothetical protein|nr:class I SAM-dependent methyltransferase [Bacteroidales bacterium]
MNKDIFGNACLDYLNSKDKKIAIKVKSDIVETDVIPVEYLFRNFDQMPVLEQKALLISEGNILDVGACAGSHSLYLQNIGKSVTSIDKSKGCCEVMHSRGVKNIIREDIFAYKEKKYDTILLLMNGIGIAGTLPEFPAFLNHLKNLLNPSGRIIFDSSDLQYLYYEDDGSLNIPFTERYYGEITYQMEYKGNNSKKFSWLFVDPFTVENIAKECCFEMQFIAEGEHYDYLACLINE